MEITNINLGACPLQYLSVGYVGETGARPVAFDFSAWATEYGSGVLQMLLQRPGDAEPYPVMLDIDGTTATWTPDATDTAAQGQGQAQLIYTVGGVVVKDAIFRVLIAPSLGAAGDPPEPYEDWLQRLTELAAETQQSAIDAAGSAEAAGTSAGAAAISAGAAAQSALDAEAAKSGAETAETTAEQAAALARAKAAEAAEAGRIAGENADYAQQQNIAAGYSAESAHDDAERAAQSAEDAQAAAAGANQAKTDAQSAASAAAGSAADAAAAVTEVETKGAEQITAINQAGTTQIAAVDAAGAAQAQAIEDKGEEVIASIPPDYTELADDVSDLKSALYSIEDFSWSSGFINGNGNIDSASDPSRQHTEYLICPENTSITYVAETNHASVLGISFYDENKTFISGIANNGTMGTAQTVTSPVRTRYCRLSTKAAILYSSYYAPAVRTLDGVTTLAYANKADLANRTDGYIAFGTNGSTRGAAVSVSGLLYARVVDNSYDISLQYKSAGGSDTNTDWVKYVDLSNYKQPFGLKIRKTDNSAMPVASANQAVVGTYMTGLATNGYVYKGDGTAYVDGTNGDDTNDGLNPTTAFATIQKAIDSGFKNILVREGTYTGGINLYYAEGVHISIDKRYSSFDASISNNNPKVVIDCDDTLNYGVRLLYANNCVLEDIEVKNARVDGFFIEYAENCKFENCIAHNCPGGNGYTIIYTNADFINCGCYNIGTMGGGQHHDGFNIHGNGTTNFINCWANYCEDDGISHHDACYGYVDGGEWHHCGKGAVCTPTHGACVDVRNVYAHDSAYGIYAGNDTASLAKTFTITNCVCLNNTTKDIHVTNNTANIWNCIYSTIDHDGVGANNVLTAGT